MGTEVPLFGCVIFGIDEDCIVRTVRHAGLTTNTNRLVEIYDSIGAFEHRRSGTSSHTGRMNALVTTRDLMHTSSLRERAYINVFDVGSCDGKRYKVLRLACRSTGMTANTAGVVDHLRPLNLLCLLAHDLRGQDYITLSGGIIAVGNGQT